MDEQTTKRKLTAEEWEARLETTGEIIYQRVMKDIQELHPEWSEEEVREFLDIMA